MDRAGGLIDLLFLMLAKRVHYAGRVQGVGFRFGNNPSSVCGLIAQPGCPFATDRIGGHDERHETDPPA